MLMMVHAAQALGLEGVTFTEHVDIGFPDPVPGAHDADRVAYLADYLKVQKEVAPYPVFFGLELGWEENFERENAAYTSGLPLDFIISSVHSLDGCNIYRQSYYEGKEKLEVYRRYLEKVLACVKRNPDFDSVGHIGFVSKNSPYADPVLHRADFPDLIDEILRTIIARGVSLEFNTSGYRMCGVSIPEPDVFHRYRELGGERVTLGSDAHNPDYVGLCFDKARHVLMDLGFRYVTRYEKRQPIFEKL